MHVAAVLRVVKHSTSVQVVPAQGFYKEGLFSFQELKMFSGFQSVN